MSLPRPFRPSPAWAVALLLIGSRIEPAQSDLEGDAQPKRILWRDPGSIAELDLSWKSDPARQAPAPPFTFIEEDASGTRSKVIVNDGNGVVWNVKLADDGETHAEVAAARLLWALGYFVEESYYVSEGSINGVRKLGRAAKQIAPDGRFRAARFEKRPTELVRTGRSWSFDRNPFLGTKELSGLMILMTMLNSWDLRGDRNTDVLQVRGDDGPQYRYLVADLGATFGRMGRTALITQRNKWSLKDFQEQKFIDGIANSALDLHFSGDGGIDLVPIDHARWFAALAIQLTDEQIRQAFETAGATAEEVGGFSIRLRQKIDELRAAVSL